MLLYQVNQQKFLWVHTKVQVNIPEKHRQILLQARHNEEVIITGDNFSFFNDNISVHFGQTAAIVNSECTNNSISVTVPDLTVDSAKIQVEIYDKSVTSTEYFYYNGR